MNDLGVAQLLQAERRQRVGLDDTTTEHSVASQSVASKCKGVGAGAYADPTRRNVRG